MVFKSLNIVLFIFILSCYSYVYSSNLWLKIIYFHGNRRCEACLINEENIEYYIKKNFKDEIKNGYIKFTVINFEEPGNEHYVDEYKLEYPKAFICEIKDEKEISAKELKKIWDYTYEYGNFEKYIVNEINSYLYEEKE